MNFKRINNITGWLVCIIACSVYIMTMEATGSLWDCGEFASSAYKLQIPHPPGAPLFVLIGRLFMAPFGPQQAALGINLMSALASGFTILFLFWTITHFARKIVQKEEKELSGINIAAIMLAGAIGALAYTFSDSFWYSAVEGEVYALSSFFTAVVFWAMLKWENAVTEEQQQGIKGNFTKADRWIILIFYLMGLSIGVHLLNLLVIPAIVMVYYFKKFRYTFTGSIIAFLIGCLITGFVQVFIIKSIMKVAGQFDIYFVNNFELPFFSGFAFFFAILMITIFLFSKYGRYFFMAFEKYALFSGRSNRKEYWIFSFINFFIISTIRATSNSSTLLLIYGIVTIIPLIALRIRRMHDCNKSGWYALIPIYSTILALSKGTDGPNNYGSITNQMHSNNHNGLSRLVGWSIAFMLLGYSSYFTTLIRSNANPSVDMFNVDNPVSLVGYLSREQYGDWPILYGQDFTAEIQDYNTSPIYIKSGDKYEENGKKIEYVYAPEDKHFFPRMWDQSNDQGHADYYAQWAGIGKDSEGKWDRAPTMSENIGFFLDYQLGWMYWRYFMWNFAGKQNDIQGVNMGNVRDGNWKTGISFYDQARLGDQKTLPESIKHNKANNNLYMLPFILGLIGLLYQFKKDKKDTLIAGLLFFFTGIAICIYLNQAGNQPRERDYAYVGSFYAFAIWIGLGMLYVKDLIFSFSKNIKLSTIAAGALCALAVPVLMACEEWDDHDRSKKTLARDLAKNYLESCAPNAILITFGDNDTYPLWYAQEVEGIRKDIRVINSSLLGTDWYINQLRYKVNESDSIDVIWSAKQIEGSNRDVLRFNPNAIADKSQYMDLYTMMKDYAGSDDPDKGAIFNEGEVINTFPSQKVSIPVDLNLVKQNGTVTATDIVLPELKLDLNKNYLYKNDAAILNIIAANKWKRPIYFTSPYDELGFDKNLRQEGLTYRLVPVENPDVNKDWVMDKMLNKFAFGNVDKKGVFFDEENRRHINSIRLAYAQVARSLAESGNKEDAKKLLAKCDKILSNENYPYGMVSRYQQHNQISMQFLVAAYLADDKPLADKIEKSIKKDMEQQSAYYGSLSDNKQDMMSAEIERNEGLLKNLMVMSQQFKNSSIQPPMPQGKEKAATDTARP